MLIGRRCVYDRDAGRVCERVASGRESSSLSVESSDVSSPLSSDVIDPAALSSTEAGSDGFERLDGAFVRGD